jgi:hypothetical protein
MQALIPLLVALSGLPALAIAAWIGGNDDARSRGLALRWALLGLAILLGAGALYWAGDSRALIYTVVIALVLVVNALALSMLLHLRRSARPER